MSKTKKQVENELKKIEGKLKSTEAAFKGDRGVMRDVLSVVIPMLQDQVAAMKDILNTIPEEK